MSIVLLVVGLILAALGGDRFVRGSVGLASWLRIPSGIIGATVAAFATSSPELTVGVLAAVDGRPDLAFGDATGSNMVNLSVVVGITLLISAITVHWREMRRELVTFVAALGFILVVGLDGRIERFEAVAMIVLFVGWLVRIVAEARRERSRADILGDTDHRAVVVDVVLGLVMLIVAGRLIVLGGKEIGEYLGWSQFVIGTVIVAIGTSAPELVTTVIALRRGEVGVGIGTVLGSNIFNSLFIVGIAGSIQPIDVDRPLTAVALGMSVVAAALLLPGRDGRLGRSRGLLLLATYAIFVGAILVVQRW
ncbi:MAG: calcium/sodium antiporter [Actinomycetota bacterium]